MARPLRIELAGGVYHITSRGNARQKIFLDGTDYRNFFSLLGDVAGGCGWQCYAYCLMPNHYHLVLTTPAGNLSKGMRHLNGVYAQRFHNRHASVGHLFQGRFKSILVDRDSYLLQVCRYVVLNPVRAGLVKECAGWRWSSYLATIGNGPKPSFLASEWLLRQFAPSPARARDAFTSFVEEGLRAESPLENVRGSVFLGSEAFVSGLAQHLAEKREDCEIPRSQRLADRPPLKDILTRTPNTALQGQQVLQARDQWGYSLTDIGRHLNLHRNTVAAIARKAAGTGPDRSRRR
jgi:REP element-mobilizing transposase RayT